MACETSLITRVSRHTKPWDSWSGWDLKVVQCAVALTSGRGCSSAMPAGVVREYSRNDNDYLFTKNLPWSGRVFRTKVSMQRLSERAQPAFIHETTTTLINKSPNNKRAAGGNFGREAEENHTQREVHTVWYIQFVSTLNGFESGKRRALNLVFYLSVFSISFNRLSPDLALNWPSSNPIDFAIDAASWYFWRASLILPSIS
jgi:hypothetical protein